METYSACDTIEYFDAVRIIENGNIQKATIILTEDVIHCHLMRVLANKKITISGKNRPKYTICIDPRDNVFLSPNWYFNTTSLFYSNNVGISFINLDFTYYIEEYDFIQISQEYDSNSNKNIQIVDFRNEQSFNSFRILFMDFLNSKINFKDCIFENNTNRIFEITAKKKSKIAFENCIFNGEFDFIFDVNSEIVIKHDV